MATCNKCGRTKWYAVSPSSGRPHYLSCADTRSLKAYWAERKRSEKQLNRQI